MVALVVGWHDYNSLHLVTLSLVIHMDLIRVTSISKFLFSANAGLRR